MYICILIKEPYGPWTHPSSGQNFWPVAKRWYKLSKTGLSSWFTRFSGIRSVLVLVKKILNIEQHKPSQEPLRTPPPTLSLEPPLDFEAWPHESLYR